MYRFSFLVVLIAIYGCNFQSDECCIELGGNKQIVQSVSYFDKISQIEPMQGDTLSQYIVFANNPFALDESFDLIIYANNQCIYKGEYKQAVEVYLGTLIKHKERVHFFIEIIPSNKSQKETYLHRFNTKKTIIWDTDFRYIYVSFFPNNEEDDRIFFFPQVQDLLL